MKQALLWRYHRYDPKNAPDYPDGMPPQILAYNWYRKVCGWDPRTVDNLTIEELEWFPIVEEAQQQASDIISSENAAQNRAQNNQWK